MSRPVKTNLPPELKSILKIIGTNLRNLREDRGLSQSELSEKSGISLTTVNEIESKQHRDIRISTLTALSNPLKVSVIEFFIDSDLKVSNSDKEQLLQASQLLQKITRKLSK